MESTLDLSREIVLWSGGYVVLLLVLGALGRRARRENSLSDFYLAGRRIGFVVLLLTLFATQYSGNSMSGFPGQTYRRGLVYVMSVTFMVGIVSGYLLFAPRLYRLSRRRGYVTPSDFLQDRFRSPALSYVASGIFAVTLFNFLLAQLLAMGHAFAGLTSGRIPFAAGVVGGAAVILVYELLGGMRAVAWTDVLQGSLLFVGMLLISGLLTVEIGGPATVIAGIAAATPEKVAVSGIGTCAVWLSNLILLGFGAPLYPQAIQRIYAARRFKELRNALAGMALMPLVAITTVIYVGAVGILLFPGLEGTEADQITFKVIAHLVELQPAAKTLVLLVLVAILAAIMSTADSCLLSLSSIVSKDFIARPRGLSNTEAESLTRWTPMISVGAMVVLVALALTRPSTLWDLLVLKFELLTQLSPAFVLGIGHGHGDDGGYTARDVLLGIATGLAVALGLYATGHRNLGGFHAGTLGVVANYLVCWGARKLRLRG